MLPQRIPRGQDAAVQRAVLARVLDAHPERLTIPTLAREIGGEGVERAIRDLVSVGLLQCGGLSIGPSAAAIYFERLELP
jgi:hypothetical protein